MGLADVGSCSLGQYTAICEYWNNSHSPNAGVEPPTRAEFEQAVMAARGVLH